VISIIVKFKINAVFAFSLCIPLFMGVLAESMVSGCFQLSALSAPGALLAWFLMNWSGFSQVQSKLGRKETVS